MPYINTRTNVSISQYQENAIKTAYADAITAIPGKTEGWLMLNFEDNCRMYFRGDSTQPIAFVEVSAYGGENPAAFDDLTGRITKILGDNLKINPDHIYIKYNAVANWGWNGGNF